MVKPGKKEALLEYLGPIPHEEIMSDVGRVVRRTNRPITTRQYYSNASYDSFFARYHSYSDMERKLVQLARFPGVTREILGKSSERRNLYIIKYSTKPDAARPVILVDAGHHAREVSLRTISNR